MEIASPLPLEESGQTGVPTHLIPLKERFESFLNRSTSENTRDAYRRTILEFHRFVGRHLLTITDREVQAWRDKLLLSDKQSNQSVATKLSIVRSFYGYLRAVYPGIITQNPANTDLVPPPPIPNALKGRALSAREARHLLVGPDCKTAEGARDYAMLLLMLRLALRVSEVARIKQSCIVWGGRSWTLRLKVKGGAEEVWPLPPDLKKAIDDYLRLDEVRRSAWGENREQDQFIFQPTHNHSTPVHNRGLSRQMICRIVRKWADFVGIKGRVSPHNLRATAITRALRQGRTYRDVQMMSKHKDPKTVMRYDYELDNLDLNPVNTLNYDEDEEPLFGRAG